MTGFDVCGTSKQHFAIGGISVSAEVSAEGGGGGAGLHQDQGDSQRGDLLGKRIGQTLDGLLGDREQSRSLKWSRCLRIYFERNSPTLKKAYVACYRHLSASTL